MTDTCGADRPGRPPADERGGSRPRSERARQVADVVRQQITTGGFPGGVLPDERALAVRFGTTRNALREALDLLRREGWSPHGSARPSAAGAALFALDRLTCLADGRPVDAESIRIRADRMTLHATLHRGAAPEVADR